MIAVQKRDNRLNVSEIDDLIRQESIIEASRNALARESLDIGRALLAINDRELFRGTHKSIGAYCKERWGYSQSYCYRLISWARDTEQNSPVGEIPERHARELAGADPAVQKLVLESIPDDATAATVKTVLEEFNAMTPAAQAAALKKDAKLRTPQPRDGMKEAEAQVNRLLGRALKVCGRLGPEGEKKAKAIKRAIETGVAA